MSISVKLFVIAIFATMLIGCSASRYMGKPNAAIRVAKQSHLGRKPLFAPKDNQLSVARIDLGRKLFHDKRLSADGTISCGTCHRPEQGYTQNDVATPTGVGGQLGRRNAPSLYDVGYRKTLFIDGRSPSLEAQAVSPLLNPQEMGNRSMDEVVNRIKGLNDYRRFFAYAFDGDVSSRTIGLALANYERALVTGSTRFDQWKFGRDAAALSEQEKAGYRVFSEIAKCGRCHIIDKAFAEFTDDRFRRNGYAQMRAHQGATDRGRAEATGLRRDEFAFRTPTLRNIALTGPYMHDGKLARLQDVVEFYSTTGLNSIAADGATPKLSEQEKRDLVAFLQSLTSPTRP